ncbi:hypothetical protein FF38_04420 [Lucilia cuprina]|uniref:Uncharacterized protein n=1 Tax=Lucilia cuprina TaxID=7375 RepID=A0A0L0BRN9_LUCCU|nr:hypothetical protein FF38_04420 [Lucilia cuprina]
MVKDYENSNIPTLASGKWTDEIHIKALEWSVRFGHLAHWRTLVRKSVYSVESKALEDRSIMGKDSNSTASTSNSSSTNVRDNASATTFSLPLRCSIVKLYPCNFSAHLASRPLRSFWAMSHLRLAWSVTTSVVSDEISSAKLPPIQDLFAPLSKRDNIVLPTTITLICFLRSQKELIRNVDLNRFLDLGVSQKIRLGAIQSWYRWPIPSQFQHFGMIEAISLISSANLSPERRKCQTKLKWNPSDDDTSRTILRLCLQTRSAHARRAIQSFHLNG